MILHLPDMCSAPVASLLPGTHHRDPAHKQTSVGTHMSRLHSINYSPFVQFYVSYKNSEVLWCAGDVASRGQGLGDVFHTEGRGQDPQGQPDHQVALRALERPAVTWVHIRLRKGDIPKISFITTDKNYYTVCFLVSTNCPQILTLSQLTFKKDFSLSKSVLTQ